MKASRAGTTKGRAINERGVIETILEDSRMAIRQRLQHADIGHIAGGEQQRTFAACPAR